MGDQLYRASFEEQQSLRTKTQAILFNDLLNHEVLYSQYHAQTCLAIMARLMDWVKSGFSDPSDPLAQILIKASFVAACLGMVEKIRRETALQGDLADLLEKAALSL